MAPNKKYLSLEEAAALLGIKPDELIRLREKGEVRGFADRGTWKFKADDIAECHRRRQPDSDPDLQIIDDIQDSDSDDLGRQATVIRKGGDPKSDSDVQLISQDLKKKQAQLSGSSAEIPTIGSDSDSDVRLVEPVKAAGKGSQSDVTLVIPNAGKKSDSDSDVRLMDAPLSNLGSDSDAKLAKPGRSMMGSDSEIRLSTTDSDIRLSPFSDSDSDVKLIGPKSAGTKHDSDSDVTLLLKGGKDSTSPQSGSDLDILSPLGSGSGIDFDLAPADKNRSERSRDEDSSIRLSGDSGIQLAGDSGIRLSDESGIRLGASSGIRLGGDSGIRLVDDSGVQLKQPADSGISLEGQDSSIRIADSGIALGDESGLDLEGSGKTFDLLAESSVTKKKGGSSKKLKGNAPRTVEDLEATVPMNFDDDDLDSTSPLLGVADDDASASELDMFNPSDTSEMSSLDDSGQNVVMFEDDEEDSPPVTKKRHQKTVEESIFEIDEVGDESLDELEVSDADLSGENDIDDLAFDDGDDDLEESFSEGTSKLGFGGAKKVPVAQEVEWSAGFCSLLLTSLCVLIAGAWVSADLLRTVWAGGEESAIYPGIAGVMGGLWK